MPETLQNTAVNLASLDAQVTEAKQLKAASPQPQTSPLATGTTAPTLKGDTWFEINFPGTQSTPAPISGQPVPMTPEEQRKLYVKWGVGISAALILILVAITIHKAR